MKSDASLLGGNDDESRINTLVVFQWKQTEYPKTCKQHAFPCSTQRYEGIFCLHLETQQLIVSLGILELLFLIARMRPLFTFSARKDYGETRPANQTYFAPHTICTPSPLVPPYILDTEKTPRTSCHVDILSPPFRLIFARPRKGGLTEITRCSAPPEPPLRRLSPFAYFNQSRSVDNKSALCFFPDVVQAR